MQAWLRRFSLLLILLLFAGPLAAAATGLADVRNDWRTASRDSAGIAPDPAAAPEAIIQGDARPQSGTASRYRQSHRTASPA